VGITATGGGGVGIVDCTVGGAGAVAPTVGTGAAATGVDRPVVGVAALLGAVGVAGASVGSSTVAVSAVSIGVGKSAFAATGVARVGVPRTGVLACLPITVAVAGGAFPWFATAKAIAPRKSSTARERAVTAIERGFRCMRLVVSHSHSCVRQGVASGGRQRDSQ
jgi:hypothetical protein